MDVRGRPQPLRHFERAEVVAVLEVGRALPAALPSFRHGFSAAPRWVARGSATPMRFHRDMRLPKHPVVRWSLLVVPSAFPSYGLSHLVPEFRNVASGIACALGVAVLVRACIAVERRLLRASGSTMNRHFIGAVLAFIAFQGAWVAQVALHLPPGSAVDVTSVPAIVGMFAMFGVEGLHQLVGLGLHFGPVDAFIATLLVGGFWMVVAWMVATITHRIAALARAIGRAITGAFRGPSTNSLS